MTVPYRHEESDYIYLTDRFGAPNEGIAMSPEDREVAQVLGEMQRRERSSATETCFAVRRTDGSYGLLMEVVEIVHDAMPVDGDHRAHLMDLSSGLTVNGVRCDGTFLPKTSDVVAELLERTGPLQDAYPDVDFEVAVDAAAFDGAAVVRAFVGRESDMFGRLDEISDDFLKMMADMRDQPVVKPPAP